MNEFVPCTSMYLPSEVSGEAARIAVEQNPANSPAYYMTPAVGIIMEPQQLAVLTQKYWGNKGVRLAVGFMEQTPLDLQKRILSHFNAWGEFCNVTFSLTTSDAQVRITRAGQGYWSYLGTDVLMIPRNQPTMCLQGFTMSISEAEFRRVVRHEVGHTLGFPHEHMRRQIVDKLDPQRTIAYFKQTQGWSAAMVQQQVLTPLAESSIMGTPDADENSIMTYSLPGQITKDGRPIIGGSDIQDQDKVMVAKLYPKADAPTPPPPPTNSADFSMKMNFTAKQVAIALPAGWTVVKTNAQEHSDSTEGEMNMNEMETYITDLESALPGELEADAERAPAPGGIISNVLALVAALRAKDWKTALVAVRDLINIVIGDGSTGGDSISFQTTVANTGLKWDLIRSILGKILPLLIELA